MEIVFKKPVLEAVSYGRWQKHGVEISILREDKIHPFINGNKWRKLKYNLAKFRESGRKRLLTFGGAYSNHLVACAELCAALKIPSIGIVRGEKVSNPYLNFIEKRGMVLKFISRSQYARRNEMNFEEALPGMIGEDISDVWIIPEGGSNEYAVNGAAEIMDDIPRDVQFIACACGTGATLAGLSGNLHPGQQLIGVSVLKNEGFLEQEIERLGGKISSVNIFYEYHCGGYAKKTPALENFCSDFIQATQIPIEPVYTGKLFFALDDLLRRGYFESGAKVTLLHSGGIFTFG